MASRRFTATGAESAAWEMTQPAAPGATSPPGQAGSAMRASAPSGAATGAAASTTSTPIASGSDQEVTSYGGMTGPPA